jgi:ketosteroid isomerase-like protein
MKRAVVLWILCVMGVLMTAQGLRAGEEAKMEPGNTAAAETEIRRLTREFVEGFNSGDVDRIMRFYADTYTDVNLRQPVQSTKERAEYYRKIIARGDTKVDVVPDEIIVAGQYAFVRGTILLDRTDKESNSARRIELRYMEVWQRFPDGWKALWGMDAEVYPEDK